MTAWGAPRRAGLLFLLSAVNCDRKGTADLSHPRLGEAAEPVDEHSGRHALHRVEVDRRAPWNGILVRLQDDLAGQSTDRRRAGGYQCSLEPRDRRVA